MMTSTKDRITNLLKGHKLRTTACRREILHLFIEGQHALTHADLEKAVSTDFDRVTVYRTLKSFEEHGLVHKVLDDSGSTKYALCTHDCNVGDHQHNHVHFKCTNCQQTVCLDGVQVPEVTLPSGYAQEVSDLLIQGVCPDCR